MLEKFLPIFSIVFRAPVKAARDLEDTIFPDMQLTQETLQIEGGK